MLMRRETAIGTGAASAVLGATFLIGALARATDGFTDEVSRVGVASVLGIITGVALLVAAFGLITQRYWGWKAGIGAHVLAIATVLIGIFSLNAGYGDRTPNLALPGVLLLLLVLSFVALWRVRPRNPLRRAKHEIAARMF
ncbi:MAG TPA: hypothetical protein VJR89_07155 [Polyangiales bacterium]|nr:hypothetical protein [Polyangiales bacterium]